MNRFLSLAFCCFLVNNVSALSIEVHDKQETNTDSVMPKDDLKQNWFIQTGFDVTEQIPYGFPASEAVDRGMSGGINFAVGRIMSPELSIRAKLNWENGIVDSKADWLAPFHKPGVNHDKGGYICVVGDIMLDVHSLIAGYDENRTWNTQIFAREGLSYNFGVSKGSPLLGVGIANTFRLGERMKLYCDVAYNAVSSGHTAVIVNTGVGSGRNAFVGVDLGLQYDLNANKKFTSSNRLTNGDFLKDCFVDVGVDMMLSNPYRMKFKDSFKKGRSYGVDVAIGKWFSPTIALRGRLNWENGLIENPNLEWFDYKDSDKSNYDAHGCAFGYLDVLLSVKHAFIEYDKDEKWDFYVFPRAGLGSNLSLHSMSPMIGAGVGGTYKLNDLLSIYADTGYYGITSEFFGKVSNTGMGVSFGFNGLWDFNAGFRINIGK